MCTSCSDEALKVGVEISLALMIKSLMYSLRFSGFVSRSIAECLQSHKDHVYFFTPFGERLELAVYFCSLLLVPISMNDRFP